MSTDDLVQRARKALDEIAAPALVADLAAEVETLRAERSGLVTEGIRQKRRANDARATLDRVRAEVPFLSARDQILIRAALDGEATS